MTSIINLKEDDDTTVSIVEKVLKNPNQIFCLEKYIFPFLIVYLIKKFEGKSFDQGYTITGGGFNFWVFWIDLGDGKFLMLETYHTKQIDYNDQQYNELYIYLYDENDSEIAKWIPLQKSWYDNDIPNQLLATSQEMEWYVFYVYQLLYNYRDSNPPKWQKE